MKLEKLFYVVISSIVIVAIILVSYLFPPFNESSGTGARVKQIYFVDNITSAHRKLINQFNEKYKGQIEVVAINLPFEKFSTNERKELLARYLRSKSDRIDIFSVDQIWVPRFAKWGYPLEEHIAPQLKDELLPYAMESCYYKNTLVAAPLYIDVTVMYYRDDILKKLPSYEQVKQKIDNSITWKDFIALSKEIKTEQPFFIFQADDYEGLICIFAEMMAGLNKPMYKNGKLQLETPEAHRALQLLVDLVNKYKAAPDDVIKFKEDASYAYFINNNGVCLRGWPGFLRSIKLLYPDLSPNIVLAPTPHFADGKAVSVFGGWNLMISRYSGRKNEALMFLNFLLSEETQKILYNEGGLLPINTTLYSDSEFINKNKDLLSLEKLLRKGVHRPFLEDYTNISDVLCYYLNLAIKKEISVNDALTEATKKINSQAVLLK